VVFYERINDVFFLFFSFALGAKRGDNTFCFHIPQKEREKKKKNKRYKTNTLQ